MQSVFGQPASLIFILDYLMHGANPANPALAIQGIITIPVLIFVGLCGFAHTAMDFQSNLPVRNDRTSRSMAVFSVSVDDITGTGMVSTPQALPDIMQ